MTVDIKDESLTSIDSSRHKKYAFFISHKGYQIHWPAPKTGYQPTLKTIFVVVNISGIGGSRYVSKHVILAMGSKHSALHES
jgi:hypothetical protein